jgi:hypothetical protein
MSILFAIASSNRSPALAVLWVANNIPSDQAIVRKLPWLPIVGPWLFVLLKWGVRRVGSFQADSLTGPASLLRSSP